MSKTHWSLIDVCPLSRSCFLLGLRSGRFAFAERRYQLTLIIWFGNARLAHNFEERRVHERTPLLHDQVFSYARCCWSTPERLSRNSTLCKLAAFRAFSQDFCMRKTFGINTCESSRVRNAVKNWIWISDALTDILRDLCSRCFRACGYADSMPSSVLFEINHRAVSKVDHPPSCFANE